MKILLLTILGVGLAMFIMSLGVVFSGRCLRGSCGGEGVIGPDGEPLLCDACPHRKEIEQAGHSH